MYNIHALQRLENVLMLSECFRSYMITAWAFAHVSFEDPHACCSANGYGGHLFESETCPSHRRSVAGWAEGKPEQDVDSGPLPEDTGVRQRHLRREKWGGEHSVQTSFQYGK
jgi:hypothetical protein